MWNFIGGLFLGSTIGFFVASLCKASSDGDKRSIMEYGTYKK